MTLEHVETRLKPGVTKEDFRAMAEKVDKEFLSLQPGYIMHTSWWTENNTWVDLVEWKTLEDAQTASRKVMDSEVCNQWFAMMDETSIKMKHYKKAAVYTS